MRTPKTPRPAARLLRALTALLALAAGAYAPAGQDPGVGDERSEQAADLGALAARFDLELARWESAHGALRDPRERRAHQQRHPYHAFAPRFEALAEAGDPRGLFWLLDHLHLGTPLAERRALRVGLYERLVREFSGHALYADGLRRLFDDARLRAEGGLADVERVVRLARADEHGEAHAALLDLGLAELLADTRGADHAARAAALLRRLLAREDLTEDLRARAAALLFELEHLRVGCPAPDFEGRTVDGAVVRLSDLRGKVVVLDFFGFWCRPCVEELPNLRRLRERWPAAELALVSVNSGDDERALRRGVERHGVDWTTVFDGADEAPITALYRVRSFPTVLVLDREGRIRYASLRGRALQNAVAGLLEGAGR